MDIRDLVKEINSSFICFPTDDLSIKTGKVCLISFHDYILENSNFGVDDATKICDLIRYFIAAKNSFYIDECQCIQFKFHHDRSKKNE